MYCLSMTNDTTFTLRLPSELKIEVSEIAEAEARSTSMVFILLLRRGIDAYRQDGILLETKAKQKTSEKSEQPGAAKKPAKARRK